MSDELKPPSELVTLRQQVIALADEMRAYEAAPALQPLGRSQQISKWQKRLRDLAQAQE
jgi:hypothetical protein